MAVAGIAAVDVLVVMDILLPAVCIWGYRSQDVRLTCEARHPAPSWTDRCPPQVLAWSITLWGCALLVIPALFRPALPVFGYVVSGMPARLLLLSSGAVAGVLAWGSYALRMPAWWGSALFLLVTGASAVTSFLRMDLIEICRAMNMPEEEIQVLRQFGTPSCSALRKLGEGKLKFVLNTHWHGDHTGGNKEFGPEAPIIAQSNVRKRLQTEQKGRGRVIAPSPKEALPVITFDESLSVWFNGEEIRALHYPRGHTDGDSVILFTGSNVLHMGDDFFSGMFPFV